MPVNHSYILLSPHINTLVMNTPKNNKTFLAISLTVALAVFAFLIANAFTGNKSNNPSFYKATINDPFRPLPLYGSNSINTHGPSWTDNAFRDSAASIDLRILRYPGGGFGDFWDWRKGWFIDDSEARTKGMTMPEDYKKLKYSPTGLKELKLLTDQSNSEVLFEVNMITRDIDDQIDMLKSARAMGFPIKWVELGNEFNVSGSVGHKRFASPKNYGAECYKWAKAIKESFPNVQIGAVGGDKQYSPDVRNWNADVLSKASNIDAVVAHIYPRAATVVDDDGINFEKLYDEFKRNFDIMDFDRQNDKKIWVTEYNVLWVNPKHTPEGQAIQNRAFTWGQALSAILMTSECTNLPGNPPLILNCSLANWRGFASIEKRSGEVKMLPNGIGIRAWCKAADNKQMLRQIDFDQSGSSNAKDFEVLGWQFKGTSGTTSLMVNFTSNPITIDLTALNDEGKKYCNLQYADKNKIINEYSDVSYKKGEIKNNRIILPPYCIATL